MGRSCESSGSSSGEEDGNADWKAAIASVSTNFNAPITNSTKSIADSNGTTTTTTEEHHQRDKKQIKLYQIKAQKLLDDLLAKSLEVVRDPTPTLDDNTTLEESGIRLFSNAPLGTTFDPIVEIQQPKKRPRIVPGKKVKEKSKKFRRRLQSVTIDGTEIIAAARDACQKSMARLEAREAAAKEAAKREEERVAELKKIRGEKWLPSIAKEMQVRSK